MSPSNLRTVLPRLPRPFEMDELCDRLLSDWAFLPVVPAGAPAAGPSDLPLEFSAELRAGVRCALVLRSTPAFGAELAYASTGDPGAREQGADAFQELCNLLCSHLLSNYLGGQSGEFSPFLPVRSTPQDWPAGEPAMATVFMADGHPVEARLWLLPPAEAPRG